MLEAQELSHPLNDAMAERATAFVVPEFRDAIVRTYGCEALTLAVSCRGFPLPAYRIKRPWKKEVTLAPYNFQPVLRDRNEDIIRCLIGATRRFGTSWSAKARLHHKLAQRTIDELGLTCTQENVETLVSLSGGVEAIVTRMHPRQRTKWRRAVDQRADLVISSFADDLALRQFYRLMARTYRDKHRMIPQPFDWFRRLTAQALAPRHVRTYAVCDRRTSRFLGGIVVITDPVQWCYAWGATDQTDGHRDLSTLLIGSAMQDAAAAGATVFSLGASPISHKSLRQFKRCWGGEEHPVLTYYWHQVPKEVDLYAGFPLAKAVVARAPLWVLRRASALAVKVLV